MTETRTPKQIAADKIDLHVFNLSRAFYAFGEDYGDPKMVEAGHQLSALRTRVRAHMHPRDREEANQ